ncbi:hypothetical protein H6P81_006311 [Aristolochia fimbriata]|uniref:Uncharacterized protein n=1 Tax=Aristolochia fimbriata TaxID=158543 RepID=A0AAV7F0U9_ARIFI|nr:hypothetical protein H6P81_006311 [Aristolochia fimbriata]
MASTKLFVSLALLFIFVVCNFSHGTARHVGHKESMRQRYQLWMRRYGRVYKSPDEKKQRFQIFKSNVEFIDSFNRAGDKFYRLSVNQFADLTNEEFKASRNGFKLPSQRKVENNNNIPSISFNYLNESEVASRMDWRKQGAVTPIKDQDQCGCCWAFSAVAAMEGLTKIKTGKLVSLSEQELVDCDKAGQNAGCAGGLMDDAFTFIKQIGGLTSEESYPYKGVEGTCNSKMESKHDSVKIEGYEDVLANSEKSLMKAVARQPVSVAIDASGLRFQFYTGGIFPGEDNDCGTDLDHGVTAVGYGTSKDGVQYWIVKNSWGTKWGEKGYIRMKKGVKAKEGACGIAMKASYPIA